MDAIQTSFINSAQLPFVIEPRNKEISWQEFIQLLSQNVSFFKKQLAHYGGILFRGFPVGNENDFVELIKQLQLGSFMNYIGGDSPRKKINEHVYTSTEAPPSVKIYLHNELSFVKNYPKYICFYCATPPEEGGATTLGDARKIYKAIHPEVRQRFTSKNLKYISAYYDRSKLMDFINSLQPAHKPWKHVFESESRQEVEQMCRESEFQFKWLPRGWIQISQVRPAVMAHPETGEQVWFNQAHLFDFNPKHLGWWRYIAARLFYWDKETKLHQVSYEDDSKIRSKDLYHVLDTLDGNTIHFPWKKGDALILDNVLTMHGRAPFSGKRRILTAMCG